MFGLDALCPLDLQCGLVYGSLYLVSGLNLWFRSVICVFSRFAAFELGWLWVCGSYVWVVVFDVLG